MGPWMLENDAETAYRAERIAAGWRGSRPRRTGTRTPANGRRRFLRGGAAH